MLQDIHIKKEHLLLIGMLLMLIICYQFAIKKTIEVYQLNKVLQLNLEASSDLTFQPEYLQRKRQNLDKILNRYQLDSLTFRGNTIAEISSIAEKENVKLIEIPAPDPFYNSNEFLIQRLDFQGDYYSMLRMIEKLQNQEGVGVLSSVNLKTKTLHNQNSKVLIVEVYLQIKK